MAVGGRRIIAGVSGSVRSLGALRAGLDEARLTGAPLVAVLAWVPAGGEFAYMRAPCPLLLKYWEEDARERLRNAFDAAFGGIPSDVTIRMLIVRAKPGPVLVNLADRPEDLLVVGYGGRTAVGNRLHGSVARYCMAHAHCPVLTVPPPDLIADLRGRRHRWRPEDFAVSFGNRVAAGPALGSGRRAVAVHWRAGEYRNRAAA